MAYTINKTDGSVLVVVTDGTLNSDTSLTLFGKNYPGYGEFLNENFVHTLESSAHVSPPPSPLIGQLWFDKTVNTLRVYDGVEFKALASSAATGTEPTNNNDGDLWWDTTNQQLKVWNGTSFVVIGPLTAGVGTGQTGAIPKIVTDTLAVDHVIVELVVDDEVVAIVSKDATFTPAVAIPKFSTIGAGLNLATDGVNPRIVHGTAANAESLGGYVAADFLQLANAAAQTMIGSLIVDNDSGVQIGTGNDLRATVSGVGVREAKIENATANGIIVLATTAAPAAVTIANNGNVTLSGALTASTYSGSGAGLTNLNASNLSSGTVPDARITGSYTGLNSVTGTGTATFAQFVGGAGGLTGLNASQLTSGTVPDARITGSYTGLTNITGSGTASFASFSGSGASLTSLNANQLTTGTVPDARITGSYTGLTNITGTGNASFGRFLGSTSDSVSAPSFSWTGETTTGMWRTAANSIGFTTNGTNRITISSAGVITTAAGTSLNVQQMTQPAVAQSGTSVNCSTGNYFTRTVSSNVSFTFDSVPATGTVYSFTFEIAHTSGDITWPASVKWSEDTAPDLTTGKTHLFMFVTRNGGTRWRGAFLADYET